MTNQQYIALGITFLAIGGAWLLGRKKSTQQSDVSLLNNNDMKNYFSDSEFTRSDTAKRLGIDNTPDENTWSRIHELRNYVLNPARYRLGKAIYITSGYRSPQLNKAVGGAANSQHVTGEAADITTKSLAGNRELFAILVQMGNFDQLIWEKGGEWIHVSFRRGGGRGQILAYDGKGYTNINNNWQNIV